MSQNQDAVPNPDESAQDAEAENGLKVPSGDDVTEAEMLAEAEQEIAAYSLYLECEYESTKQALDGITPA